MRKIALAVAPFLVGGVLVALGSPFLDAAFPRVGLWLALSGLAGTVGYLVALVRPRIEVDAPPGEVEFWKAAYEALFHEKRALLDRVEELSTLREVALTITSILEFQPMVETILEVTSDAVEADEIFLYLVPSQDGERRGRLEAVAGRLGDGRPAGPEALAAATRRAERITWRRISSSTSLFLRDEGANRLFVPLAGRGECLGAIEFVRSPSKPYTESDRRRAATLGGTVSVALTNARLYEMAVTDGLTGLFVHRHFQHRLDDEIRRAARTGRPLSLMLIDIDHFKKFNDEHGHQTGDRVLAGVAKVLRGEARGIDVVARYGGEEMAMILPETDAEGAAVFAERVRAAVEAASFEGEGGTRLSVTISVGVATWQAGEARRTFLGRADRALYMAKEAGRNRVELATPLARSPRTAHLPSP